MVLALNNAVFQVVLAQASGNAHKKRKKKEINGDSVVQGPWSKKHSKWIALGGINKNTLNSSCIDRICCSSRMSNHWPTQQGLDALHLQFFYTTQKRRLGIDTTAKLGKQISSSRIRLISNAIKLGHTQPSKPIGGSPSISGTRARRAI